MSVLDKANDIKRLVTMHALIQRYGYDTNRAGFIRCPFHDGDRTPSLKLYPDGWHCFGCNRGGSVIDFVMLHDGLSFHDACKHIDAMFSLGLYGSLSFSQFRAEKQEQRKRSLELAQRKSQEKADMDCRIALCKYRQWLWYTQDRNDNNVKFDLAYLDRLLDQEALLLFDPEPRIQALLTKHKNGGDFHSSIRNVPDNDCS